MTIHDISLKFKEFMQNSDILLSILIVAISLSSFALGRYSVTEKATGTISSQQKAEVVNSMNGGSVPGVEKEVPTETSVSPQQGSEYVASKNGTKYHLPWCSGAKRIKEENKVFFQTKEEAEKAGYAPASNCKGI